jgi:hypothetical protein
MAKKTDVATATPPVKHALTLTRSIGDDARMWDAIELVTPRVHHLVQAETEAPGGGLRQSMLLVSLLSGVPEAALNRLTLPDLKALQKIVAAASAPKNCIVTDGDDHATFELGDPIETDNATITTLRLRTPDVEAMLTAEKFKGPNKQTSAMIASLSGQMIPVIHRLSVADFNAIDRWLTPFVSATDSTEGPGET